MTHIKRGAVLFAVVAVAVGMLAAPAAATSHVDTLAGDGTDTIQNFNATDTDQVEYTLSSSGTDFGTDGTTTVFMNMTVNDEHVSVSNSSIASADTSYTFTINQSEMGTIPGDANETTTVTVNAWGEDDAGTVTTGVTTFAVDVVFEDGYAVVYAGDTAADGNVDGVSLDTMSDEPFLGLSTFDDGAMTETEADNVGLGATSEGTTVHVVVANTSSEDPFATAAEAGGFFANYDESGAYMPTHQLLVEDNAQAVFNSEPPEALVDGYTYATVGDRNGHDAYQVHVDEDFEDESSIDVTTRANSEYGPFQKRSVRADAYGGWLNSVTASTATGGQLVA